MGSAVHLRNFLLVTDLALAAIFLALLLECMYHTSKWWFKVK
jgi:hypothetical protein